MVSIGITALILSILTLIMQLLITYIKQSKSNVYDYDKRMIKYDQMRDYYEQKLYEMNEKLVADKERWIEANHLILSGNNNSINEKSLSNKYTNSSNFLIKHGLHEDDLKVERLEVFVLTSFISDERKIYDEIKKTCELSGLNCSRSDEEFIETDILSHILRKIAKARIIIANIDGRNSNVFYELGIAHALDKPTIMISREKENVPFDLQSKNIIFYKTESDLKIKLAQELNKTILSKEMEW